MPRPRKSGQVPSAKKQATSPVKAQSQSSDIGFWLFLGCLVISASLFFRGGSLPFGGPTPGPDDENRQVVPDGKKVDLKQAYIVRVYESAEMPSWLTVNVRDDSFWKDFVAEKFGSTDRLLSLDPMQGDKPNPDAAAFIEAAKKRGLSPPFWLVANDSSGTVVVAGSLSESETTAKIREKILKVAK